MATVKLELTQNIIDHLDFAKQPQVSGGKISWRKTPAGTHDWFLSDTQVAGLQVRLTPGSVTWIIRRKLAGRTVRRAMGAAQSGGAGELLTLAQARKRAEQWRGLMAGGRDPRDEQVRAQDELKARQQRERLTMRVAFADYMEARQKKSSAGTHKDRGWVQKWMEKSPLWDVPVIAVTRDDVERSLGPLLARARGEKVAKPSWGPKKPGSMDKIYVYTQEAWKRAAAELHLPPTMTTPFLAWRKDVKWVEPKRRTRFLDTYADAGEKWVRAVVDLHEQAHDPEALRKKPWRAAMLDYYICILIWGTRLSETAQLEWGKVDEDHQVVWLAPETTKTRVLGCVPLTEWVREILAKRRRLNEQWRSHSRYVFPSRREKNRKGERVEHLTSPQKVLAMINDQAGVKISTHDLRRTLATDIAGERHPQEASSMLVAGAALQHAQQRGGIASATTEGYVIDRARTLRPIYQEREDRLRQLAGLRPLGKAPKKKGDDAMIEKIIGDPALLKKLLARWAEAGK